MTTPVYCFVHGVWGNDVMVLAVCGECGIAIGHHFSSNTDWAKHDIMRPYHEHEYTQHMIERHSHSEIEVLWLDKPLENPELSAWITRANWPKGRSTQTDDVEEGQS